MAYPANIVRKSEARTVKALGEALSYANVLLAVNTSDGLMYQASDSASQAVVGVLADINRSSAIGDTAVAIPGPYWLPNSATSPIAATDIGTDAYVDYSNDGYTVAKSGTCNSNKVGKIIDYSSSRDEVLVDVGTPA